MPKTINDLYAESQTALAAATLANFEACSVIAKLVKGELKTSWFTVTESPAGINWSYKAPEAEAITSDMVGTGFPEGVIP